MFKPTPAQIAAARDTTIPDVIAADLRVLFCGINPSLYSAAVGHHFARPGNRFWPALHAAGITERLLSPFEDRELLSLGYGISNIVARATAAADELSADELRQGIAKLKSKVRRYRPKVVAFLGISAYRIGMGQAKATLGPQAERIAGSKVWVLPNPSGLNAHYQVKELADWYRKLHQSSS